MSGPLAMTVQEPIQFQDLTSGNFVGLRGPNTVPTSYTVSLPATAPVAGQFLVSTSASTLLWATLGGAPSASRTIFRHLDRKRDAKVGTITAPLRSILRPHY